jgi:hypothetical protein
VKRTDRETALSPATPARLPAALRAAASGIHPLEAGTSLLIECGCWLHREDFTGQFVTTATSISDGTTLLATINWEAAITALDAGKLPCSGGERRVLRLAASIAGAIPVNLYDNLPGLDQRNARLLINAIRHATGQASQ